MSRQEFLPFGRPDFSEQEIAAVSRVLRSGWVGMGPETIAFEQELAVAVGAPRVVLVNSCTSALFLSLLVSGVGPGDEVICPSLTWCSTANAALYLRARPVFCDVDPDTLCLTPETVAAKLTPKTKAVVAVHFGGLAADVAALRTRLAEGVALIEDAAHAFGARFPDGRPVGSSGNLTCFSFYANKNLSTGEGGAVALADAETAKRLDSLRQNALPINAWKRFSHSKALLVSEPLTELGYKMNYTDLQAAVGRVQLARQSEFAATRLAIARYYAQSMADLRPAVRFQSGLTDSGHARHLCVVRLPLGEMNAGRDEFLVALREKNIGAAVHYAPLHRMPLYAGDAPAALPQTEAAAEASLTLPISASMTIADAEDVVAEFRKALERSRKPAPSRYGFQGRLNPDFPSQVIVDVTENCNLACIHCPHPSFRRSEHFGGHYLDQALNDKMVAEVRDHGQGKTRYIRYSSSGETLLHPKLFDMLDHAAKNAGVPVTLTTNGTLLNEDKIEKLLSSGIHLVDISIDALTDETYSRVRVNGRLGVTRANVLRLLEEKRRSGRAWPLVAVSFVEQTENAGETAGFEAFWKTAGADRVVVRRLHSAAGSISAIAEGLRGAGEERRPCLYPWERILITPQGKLAFCPQDWVHGSVVADYGKVSIREVWQGAFYRGLRQAHACNDFKGHSFCGQCPDWRQTRWPGEGLSYADLVQDVVSANVAGAAPLA